MEEPQQTISKTNPYVSSSSSSTSKNTKKAVKPKENFSSEFLRQKLREYFKHSDFKSNLQKDAIKEIMRGKHDVFISMPTGSGKSLCFQLPGMLHENKVTIVFSPLIALIKDQMDHLTKLKICAESLNSKMTIKERERVVNDLKSIKPNTKFLYITPEQAATDFFRGLLNSIVKYNKLALVAVDECHCVSEMGHQFRKDYLKLGELRLRYPTTTWIALTATASKDVTEDVFKQLALKEPKSFKISCFRKNLFYDIIYKNSIQDEYIHLKEFALNSLKTKRPNEKPNKAPCGIIYCRTRESVERVAIALSKQDVQTKAYHAGLNDKDRKQTQEDWKNGKFPVICATNSFGMGVDNATVRFVVHWDVPQSIAAYYQESGRAGRDGKQSHCRLYYCRQEVKTINFLLNQQVQKNPENVKSKRSVKEFDILIDHCESLRCRHMLFSQYFGDKASDCKKRQLCDVCKDTKQTETKLETFHRLALNSFTSKMMKDADFDGSDLYEGGRNAVRETEASYSVDHVDDDSGFSSSARRDANAKKETTNLIQKEFERRKQKIEHAKKLEQTQTRSFGIRIKSSIHTSKIVGLDVKKRESYLDFLLKVLKENSEKASEKLPHELKACDFEDIAAELEYNCFTKNRVLALYTKAITLERLRIDRSTKKKELMLEIKNHTPKKRVAHGGSAEAMQQDLNDFIKQHNIQNNVTDNQNTSTHINGFQTASQINNKLKEPNSMKKDPLTQMSINSFFTTASVKREPEEHVDSRENGMDNTQRAKRRKLDNSGVQDKVKPIDKTDNPPSLNVKNEPIDYDSDGGTEKGSDDEMDTEPQPVQLTERSAAALTSLIGPINKKTEHTKGTRYEQDIANIQRTPTTEMLNIKSEANSDFDTDEASDNEDIYQTVSNRTPKVSTKKQIQTSQHVESLEFEQRQYIKPESIEDEPTTMVVSEPIQIEEKIQNEHNDEDTDDENLDGNAEKQVNIRQSANRYLQSDNQQPSTSNNSNYDSFDFASTSSGIVQVKPNDTTILFSQLKEPLYNVGSKSARQVNTADGHPLLRFNQFNSVSEPLVLGHIEVIDDDADMDWDDLADEIEKYQSDLQKQYDEEMKQLQNIKMESLNQTDMMELRKRLDHLKRKKEKLLNERMKEWVQDSEEKQEEVRDKFMLKLFGLEFDILSLTRRMDIKSNHATTRRNSSSEAYGTDKDQKRKIKYNEFMKKQKIKPEHEKTIKKHRVTVAINDHIRRMQIENKLDTVPQSVIDNIKKDKTTIKKMVDKYLMPYYTNGTINRQTYTVICQKVTQRHFEYNDYDSGTIGQRVKKMVKAVLEAASKAKQST